MRSLLYLALLALPAVLQPGAANAVVATTQTTYYFSGTCTDCRGTALGELTLSNYAAGQSINNSNFVSFQYDGTDLLSEYIILNGPGLYVVGSIRNPLPGTDDFYLTGFAQTAGGERIQQVFETFADGRWDTGLPTADYGATHLWSATPAATAVPEPMSAALLGAGVLGTAMARRRRVG